MRYRFLILILLCCVAGCVKSPTTPIQTVPVPVPTPALEKTFGEIQFSQDPNQIQLQYKNISIGVNNPSPFSKMGDTRPDYLLITAKDYIRDIELNLVSLDQKIITPAGLSEKYTSRNFTFVKGLEAGQKILLKKENNFIFVTAFRSVDTATKNPTNGYFLECDNGRNILITGGISNMDVLRPFLYDLRDEGKEVHVALVSGDPSSYVEVVSLFQPKIAILLSEKKVDLDALRQPLQDAFFQGQIFQAISQQSIPF